jgi:putative NADH-flavin reductase
MQILLFGATGRVGQGITQQLLAQHHSITLFVRNKNKIATVDPHLTLVEGDVYNRESLLPLTTTSYDAIINVVGADPLKPSTLFTDATRTIIDLFQESQSKRYFAITGTAQMPKTTWGTLTTEILKRTPVGHAIADHQAAYALIRQSKLEWTLIGCPYIKDGPTKSHYQTAAVFPGGFKTIHPGDVADAIVQQLHQSNLNHIIGVWY